jgi:hypothetical protein
VHLAGRRDVGVGSSATGRASRKSGHLGHVSNAEIVSQHLRRRDEPSLHRGCALEVINLANRSLGSCAANSAIMNGRSMLSNKPRGVWRVDDRRVLNGTIWALRAQRYLS